MHWTQNPPPYRNSEPNATKAATAIVKRQIINLLDTDKARLEPITVDNRRL
jgi:hypothetical protein